MNGIVCFHLLNDNSGSPRVLRDILRELDRRGVRIELNTSHGGILDTLAGTAGINIRTIPYRFDAGMRLPRFTWAQIRMFFAGMRHAWHNNVFYINTLLPVGAAIAGRLTGHRVVYHCHENAREKGWHYRLLQWCMCRLASDIICVSQSQRDGIPRKRRMHVVPNFLSNEFLTGLLPFDPQRAFACRRVLMLSSLRRYKGVPQFLRLAESLPDIAFELVLNESPQALSNVLRNVQLPSNVIVHSRQKDITPFYNRASLLLNLSDPAMISETFGLTALEAMGAGLPAIVPPTGGIAEIVTDGVNGYHVDVNDFDRLRDTVAALLDDYQRYARLAQAAHDRAADFSAHNSVDTIRHILLG